ncbi:hypothetical protein ACQ4OD_13150 [Pseudomonas sp. WC1]|uniref:hypothetical protein n=1 Tax=Pseudomonas sp. WC1 TaxID=3424772 RepID=UPI003D32E8D1
MKNPKDKTASALSIENAQRLLKAFHASDEWETPEHIRAEVFSTLTVGAPIYRPYWFSKDTHYLLDIWKQELDDGEGNIITRTIDFNVRLPNGLLLTQGKNRELLDFFKFWIAAQVHPRYNGSFFKPLYAQAELTRVLYTIDWIILNAERFQICEYGLGLIGERHYEEFLISAADLPVCESVYKFHSMTETYIRTEIQKIDQKDFAETIERNEWMCSVPGAHMRSLNLTNQEIVFAHYIFWRKGWYTPNRGALKFRTRKLLEALYKNTLHGSRQRPNRFEDLDIGEEEYSSEYLASETRLNYTEGVTYNNLDRYISTLRKATAHTNEKFYINRSAIFSLTPRSIMRGCTIKPDGRFIVAPTETISDALKSSFEFMIEHCDFILCHVFIHLKNMVKRTDGSKILDNLSDDMRSEMEEHYTYDRWSLTRSGDFFYQELRMGKGICELYQVLIGCICLTTFGLAARRVKEVANLDATTCLYPAENPYENSDTQFWIVFEGAKSGAGAYRQTLKRPIPRIAAKMLYKLIKFHSLLSEHKLVNTPRLLLSVGRMTGQVSQLSRSGIYNYLEIACDFIETHCFIDTNEIKRRHYLRPHGLRRFFALLFFNSSDNNKLTTIAWMLGHTDLSSFYRYVTEIVGVRAMNEAKAHKLARVIKHDDADDITNLPELINKIRDDFNSLDVMIRTSHELHDDLSYLSEEGMIEMDPSFEKFMASEILETEIFAYLNRGEITLEPNFFKLTDSQGETLYSFNLALTIRNNDEPFI